jgi:hypothetical protein
MSVFDQEGELAHYITQLIVDIDDDCRADQFTDEPSIQLTLACNDDGSEYATQTGDNSFTGSAYGFPHWAVTTLTRDSEPHATAKVLLRELSDLVCEANN